PALAARSGGRVRPAALFAEPAPQAVETGPAGDRDPGQDRAAGGRELHDVLLDGEPHDVAEDHRNTSEVESPPCRRISCARAGPSGRAWKSTKKSGSTAIEPSSAMSTFNREERSSGY